MDEKKKYAAFSIPRRESPPIERTPAPAETRPPADIDLKNQVPFAEIEYQPAATSLPPRAQGIIPRRQSDPIREKFFEMRSLAPVRTFSRSDPDAFYRQAGFMEDFSDDYGGRARFFMYYPSYQFMGYEQLRTYFTWRARARRGEYPDIELSYIFLHMYELISLIGADGPEDALLKLLSLYLAYREREPTLNKYLPGWIKDFFICYDLPVSFMDFITGHELQGYYIDMLLFEPNDTVGRLAMWSGVSSYDITKSKFYNDGNQAVMADCFEAVHGALGEMCAAKGSNLELFMRSEVRRGIYFWPFTMALYPKPRGARDRRVELPGREVYTLKDGYWLADRPEPNWERREFAGHIIKKTESELRRALKYKYKITARLRQTGEVGYRLARQGITIEELDSAIERAVTEFVRDMSRTVVRVDFSNLMRIREEALSTQERLIVPEEQLAEAQSGYPPAPAEPAPPPPAPASDGWSALNQALNDTERRALALIMEGGDPREFADGEGIMLELLADGINEKAADCVGDNIIELDGDIIVVYGEYADKIAGMVG